MIFLYFEQGAALWVTKEPQYDMTYHKTELFFKENYLGFSIVTVYGKDCNLQRLWIFKEDSRGFPSEYWSTETH